VKSFFFFLCCVFSFLILTYFVYEQSATDTTMTGTRDKDQPNPTLSNLIWLNSEASLLNFCKEKYQFKRIFHHHNHYLNIKHKDSISISYHWAWQAATQHQTQLSISFFHFLSLSLFNHKYLVFLFLLLLLLSWVCILVVGMHFVILIRNLNK